MALFPVFLLPYVKYSENLPYRRVNRGSFFLISKLCVCNIKPVRFQPLGRAAVLRLTASDPCLAEYPDYYSLLAGSLYYIPLLSPRNILPEFCISHFRFRRCNVHALLIKNSFQIQILIDSLRT
jgi:hypothetical protein